MICSSFAGISLSVGLKFGRIDVLAIGKLLDQIERLLLLAQMGRNAGKKVLGTDRRYARTGLVTVNPRQYLLDVHHGFLRGLGLAALNSFPGDCHALDLADIDGAVVGKDDVRPAPFNELVNEQSSIVHLNKDAFPSIECRMQSHARSSASALSWGWGGAAAIMAL
jgi:hypothetical protein